jgi:hypothetical protein
MQPGIRGLLVLPAAALGGHLVASFLVRQQRRAASEAAARLVEHSIMAVVVGTIFWFWAAYKVLALHDPDLGVVTFLIANVTNYRTADLCAVLANRPRRSTVASLMQQQWVQPVADAVVACNYLLVLVAIPTLPGTFQLYLLVGGAFWAAAALRVRTLHAACDFAGMATLAGARENGNGGCSDDDASRAPLRQGADVEDAGLPSEAPTRDARGY